MKELQVVDKLVCDVAAAALGKHGAVCPGVWVDGLDGGGTTAPALELDLRQHWQQQHSSSS